MSPAPPRGPAIDVFWCGGGRYRTCRQHPLGDPSSMSLSVDGVIDVFNFGGGCCRTCRQHPPGGPSSTSSTSVLAAAGPTVITPTGPTIDVFNFGGGRYRTYRQHPQGAHHRRLYLQWWSMPVLPPAPPRGATIDVFSFSGGYCRTCRQHPQGVSRRHLLALMVPSMSSTSVVAAARPAANTPQGGRHRHLQLRWWPLSDPPPALPRGPTTDIFSFGGGRYRTCCQHP
jgi:hypothetical protein